ncbi:MAG: nuclear transport factor 2 family protein [Gammaproteobacteria bacterium]|jgi:limonene-1,2-epoxide hydrolase
MEPREVVRLWVACFNQKDADAIADLYSEDATNHQVVRDPVVGKDAIRDMFAGEFAQADMVCQIENIFQDGDWAILEWTDPNGLRGCGFFNIHNDRIVFQRGYFNELSFLRLQGLPLPTE